MKLVPKIAVVASAVLIAVACMGVAMPVQQAQAVTKPAKVKSVKVKTTGVTKVKVTWKKVKGAKGYKIRYSTKSSMKGAKTVTVKGGKKKAKTIKKLAGCTKYYVQVRAYKSKKKMGKWSKKRAVTTNHATVTVAGLAPTCAVDGCTSYLKCKKCGLVIAKRGLGKLGHDIVGDDAVEATCTENGLAAGEHCSRCDYKKAQDVVSAKGHGEVGHAAKAATCTEAGWDAYVTCSRCSYSTYKQKAALGHAMAHHAAVAATASTAGNVEYWTCSRCEGLFLDAAGTRSTTAAAVIVPATGKHVDLNTLTWAEIKAAADEIAACETEEAALEVAKQRKLVNSDGKLVGDETKTIKLSNNTICTLQILGFWHDNVVNADGEVTGKAGITFGFKEIVFTRQMNSTETCSGGWRDSDMRAWLNDGFLAMLPSDLSGSILSVEKKANNAVDSDVAAKVSSTSDKVWLLSMGEVFDATNYGAPYSKEGSQYKLYSDNGVDGGSSAFLKKYGIGSSEAGIYWLRTVDWQKRSMNAFRMVEDAGDWNGMPATFTYGVAPAFCL